MKCDLGFVSFVVLVAAWIGLTVLSPKLAGQQRILRQERQRLRAEDQVFMDDSDRNLFWFVHVSLMSFPPATPARKEGRKDSRHYTPVYQVSDLHLNKFPEHADRIATFRRFADTVPKVVDPEFLIITGDLTDGWESPLCFA